MCTISISAITHCEMFFFYETNVNFFNITWYVVLMKPVINFNILWNEVLMKPVINLNLQWNAVLMKPVINLNLPWYVVFMKLVINLKLTVICGFDKICDSSSQIVAYSCGHFCSVSRTCKYRRKLFVWNFFHENEVNTT